MIIDMLDIYMALICSWCHLICTWCNVICIWYSYARGAIPYAYGTHMLVVQCYMHLVLICSWCNVIGT